MTSTRSISPRPTAPSAWVRDAPAPSTPKTEIDKPKVRYSLPGEVLADVRKAFVGTTYQREKMVTFLTRAAEAYDRHRYEESLRLAKAVADVTPGVPSVRELTGLAAYRCGSWPIARTQLRAHFALTGDATNLPLILDCERATRKFRSVKKTYDEILESEPTSDVLAEANIVMAATLADQKLFNEAIELLTKAGATKLLRNPAYRHVRLWYALGDVYDRAGDTSLAREMFARVVKVEPDAYDAQERLGDLGTPIVRKNRKRRVTPVSKKKFVD